MYHIRNKTAPLTFSGRFEKICHRYPTNLSQLITKLLKPHLTKENSESHLEGISYGITFSKILKKKLNHFRSLILNWHWNCFLLAMKLHTFKIFQLWVCNIRWRKGAWWQSRSGFMRVLPRFKNQYESYYLQLEKIFMQCIMFL